MLKLIPFYASLMGRDLLFGGETVDKTATQSHVLIYGAIEAHAMGEKGCIAGNNLIGKETGLSTSRTASIISELCQAGWVDVYLSPKGFREKIVPKMTLATCGNPPLPRVATPLATAGNIEHSIEHKGENSSSSGKPDGSDSVQAVGEANQSSGIEVPAAAREAAENRVKFFKQLCKILEQTDRTIFTATRENKMKRRLKVFKPSEITEAAENLMKSPWHTGTNPNNTKYASYDFLMKNDEKVEEWLNKKPIEHKKSAF